MGFVDKLRNALDIPKFTEDGLKYQVAGNEIRIVGFRKNISISALPSHIEDLPVGIISGLQRVFRLQESCTFRTQYTPLRATHLISQKALPKSIFRTV